MHGDFVFDDLSGFTPRRRHQRATSSSLADVDADDVCVCLYSYIRLGRLSVGWKSSTHTHMYPETNPARHGIQLGLESCVKDRLGAP